MISIINKNLKPSFELHVKLVAEDNCLKNIKKNLKFYVCRTFFIS